MKQLTDEAIDAIADSMEGGLDGFMKGWGWRQFARALLRAASVEPDARIVTLEHENAELKKRLHAVAFTNKRLRRKVDWANSRTEDYKQYLKEQRSKSKTLDHSRWINDLRPGSLMQSFDDGIPDDMEWMIPIFEDVE